VISITQLGDRHYYDGLTHAGRPTYKDDCVAALRCAQDSPRELSEAEVCCHSTRNDANEFLLLIVRVGYHRMIEAFLQSATGWGRKNVSGDTGIDLSAVASWKSEHEACQGSA
jgi:hypothetical protein